MVIEPVEQIECDLTDPLSAITLDHVHADVGFGGRFGWNFSEVTAYVYDTGDIIWLELSSSASHE